MYDFEMILILVSTVICGILNSEMDTLKFKPSASWFPKSPWWVEGGYATNQQRTPTMRWLFKYPFSFFLDGWHTLKSLIVIDISITIGLLQHSIWWGWMAWIVFLLFSFTFIASYDY